MTPFTRVQRTIRNLKGAVAFAVVAVNILAGLSGLGGTADAATPTLPVGKKTITLVSANGERLVIGTVTLTATGAPDAPQRTIDVKLDAPDFGDQFLSMRPFRCLPDPKEMWCHLAYTYALKNEIEPADLTDLEYRLLFIYRSPDTYGIDAWNGIYFDLSVEDGGRITGAAHEVDLNILAVPPDDPTIRPIGAGDLNSIDPGTHRFARVEIE